MSDDNLAEDFIIEDIAGDREYVDPLNPHNLSDQEQLNSVRKPRGRKPRVTKTEVIIPNRDRKIESIVLWMQSGMEKDEIEDNLGTWIDDEDTVAALIREAEAELNKPKSPDEAVKELYERMINAERQITDLRGSLGAIANAVGDIKVLLDNRGE